MAIAVTVGWPSGAAKPSVQLSIPADDAVEVIAELAKVIDAMPSPVLQEIHDMMSNSLPK